MTSYQWLSYGIKSWQQDSSNGGVCGLFVQAVLYKMPGLLAVKPFICSWEFILFGLQHLLSLPTNIPALWSYD